MTLEEAIEILSAIHGNQVIPYTWEGTEAFKLGIEALKRVQFLKQHGAYYVGGLLPGETEN